MENKNCGMWQLVCKYPMHCLSLKSITFKKLDLGDRVKLILRIKNDNKSPIFIKMYFNNKISKKKYLSHIMFETKKPNKISNSICIMSIPGNDIGVGEIEIYTKAGCSRTIVGRYITLNNKNIQSFMGTWTNKTSTIKKITLKVLRKNKYISKDSYLELWNLNNQPE